MMILKVKRRIENCYRRAVVFILRIAGNRKIKKGEELCSPKMLNLNERISRHIAALMRGGIT